MTGIHRESFKHDFVEDEDRVAVFSRKNPDDQYLISDLSMEVEE